MRLRLLRLILAMATAFSALTLTAPAAQAGSLPCEMDLITWQPQLNSNDQPFSRLR
jgi:hypothetical protein